MAPAKNMQELADSELASLEQVRSSLSKLWLISALVIGLVLIAQSLSGHYGEDPEPAWKWFLGSVMPTVGVIVGALCYTALDARRLKYVVRRSFLRLCYALSIVYLLLVVLTIAIEPFVAADSFELMRISKYWLAPVQTLVASVIGVLFFKAAPPESSLT
ncbi:hypothetical protein [Tunturiibacter gelidoferens]|uniref:FlaA1/EpsC-like NDP-sugar epimerase n=2 Tax=Tunturiibacter TaxID=3154218 RepID=A0A7Y9NK11_9BACT|nr:hypothetical protein [Edaphobacter lichenicola]MBB5340039.1 FlaA1/EpsC-like NDP-sugar epimerase [Edaphobacter lichenicola]NYF50647.1 FlaA1/EpsC-like NDP-sugar epimerase [Edaphobacter lichenicola]